MFLIDLLVGRWTGIQTCGLLTTFYTFYWHGHMREALGLRVRRNVLVFVTFVCKLTTYLLKKRKWCPDLFFAWCCTCCVIAQEGREIKKHLEEKGLEPHF